MINKDLQDSVTRLLGSMKARLDRAEKQIKAFKEYDANRKKYYSKLSIHVGELESYIQELESGEHDKKCQAQNKELHIQNEELKKQVKALTAKLFLTRGNIDYVDDSKFNDLAIQIAEIERCKNIIAAKNREIKRLREQISKIVK